jgi:hypothetical protein
VHVLAPLPTHLLTSLGNDQPIDAEVIGCVVERQDEREQSGVR